MQKIRTAIIPQRPIFVGKKKTLDRKAICVFAATGFFLDQDTYYKEQKVLKPGCDYEIDMSTKTVISGVPYFKWHYSPEERPLQQIVEEFATLFEDIIQQQTLNKKTILPLSGGLAPRVWPGRPTPCPSRSHLG